MGKAGYTTNASYAARAAQIRSNRIVYQASPASSASPATTLRVSRQEKGGQMQHYNIATTFEELVKEASSPRATTFPEMVEAARASRAAAWAASPNAIAMAERQAADLAADQKRQADKRAVEHAERYAAYLVESKLIADALESVLKARAADALINGRRRPEQGRGYMGERGACDRDIWKERQRRRGLDEEGNPLSKMVPPLHTCGPMHTWR